MLVQSISDASDIWYSFHLDHGFLASSTAPGVVLVVSSFPISVCISRQHRCHQLNMNVRECICVWGVRASQPGQGWLPLMATLWPYDSREKPTIPELRDLSPKAARTSCFSPLQVLCANERGSDLPVRFPPTPVWLAMPVAGSSSSACLPTRLRGLQTLHGRRLRAEGVTFSPL